MSVLKINNLDNTDQQIIDNVHPICISDREGQGNQMKFPLKNFFVQLPRQNRNNKPGMSTVWQKQRVNCEIVMVIIWNNSKS